MRVAEVFTNGVLAGTLSETDDGKYIFKYDDAYLLDSRNRAISLSLPKRKEAFVADELFPFFYNMLLDHWDSFGRYFHSEITSSHHDTVTFMQYVIEVVYSLLVLDLGDYLHMTPGLFEYLMYFLQIVAAANE